VCPCYGGLLRRGRRLGGYRNATSSQHYQAHEAQQLLRNGTFDLPRMSKVLENQRVFLLIDEATVRRYKADLADEIEPQINELIDRAEKGLNALNRREGLIQSKVEVAQAMQSKVATAPTSDKREERRLQMLAKQRQRLEVEAKVLESEILALVCTVPQVMNYTEPCSSATLQ